jgi:hypothetical protein
LSEELKGFETGHFHMATGVGMSYYLINEAKKFQSEGKNVIFITTEKRDNHIDTMFYDEYPPIDEILEDIKDIGNIICEQLDYIFIEDFHLIQGADKGKKLMSFCLENNCVSQVSNIIDFDVNNVHTLKDMLHSDTVVAVEEDSEERDHFNVKFLKNRWAETGNSKIDKVNHE